MTTTPEIEAVARAIYETDHADGFAVNAVNLLQWKALRNGGQGHMRDHYIGLARAGLLAIRELTDDLHEVAEHADIASSGRGIRQNEHRAMIDHILGDAP